MKTRKQPWWRRLTCTAVSSVRQDGAAAIACQIQLQSSAGGDAFAWDRAMVDLHKTADPGGTFSYTCFKAIAVL